MLADLLNRGHGVWDGNRRGDSLLRCFPIEVFIVGLRVGAGMVDHTIPMIRRCVKRIEFQRNTAGIDDVVICPRRNEHREAGPDRRPNAIKDGLTAPFLGLSRHHD